VTASEEPAVDECVQQLFDLEEEHGTRVLELAIDGLRGDRRYAARSRGARPELLRHTQTMLLAVGMRPPLRMVAEPLHRGQRSPCGLSCPPDHRR
jgi:hypothetical protein